MSLKNETYAELAAAFKSTRSDRTFKRLMDKMMPGLRRYIFNLVKDPDLTEDMLSDVMASVYYKIDQYKPEYQITTWAYRIAYNACMGHFRKKKPTISMSKLADNNVEVTNSGEASFYVVEAEEAMMTDDDRYDEERLLARKHNMAENAIRSLPPLYRPYLEELLINEKSYAEIFDIMKVREKGINEQTVKNRIFNGRKMLQKQLMQTKLFSEEA